MRIGTKRYAGALLATLWAAAAWAAGRDPAAEELMERVRRSMPEVPLEMEAAIRVVDKAGKPLKTVRAEARLAPTEGGRTARYALFDAFGVATREMTVELEAGSI